MRKILASMVLVAGAIVLFRPLVYGQVDIIPSQQTHGDITFLFANHTLGGNECFKNKYYGSSIRQMDACQERFKIDPEFYGPYFSKQNMSDNVYISSPSFYADKPSAVFEIRANLNVPDGEFNEKKLVIPLRGYFYTDYKEEELVWGLEHATRLETYYGHGQVEIGGNFWYDVPARYWTQDNNFRYGIFIGLP
jgi:hypothetical protein